MSNRKAAQPAAAGVRACRPGLAGPALALLAMIWTSAPGEPRADTIVLQSGEVLDGAIIDATRNTVVIQPAIGGMRQMRIRDIAQVRLEVAQGQAISGEFLSWADGVYEIRSGAEIVRIKEGDVLSREPRVMATGQAPRKPPARPVGEPTARTAAAPAASAAKETAEKPAGEKRTPAGANESLAVSKDPSLAVSEDASLAGSKEASLTVTASVDPAEPGAKSMGFTIELSRPAEQTVVLIYGTVEGTAKAGTDYEPRQGMMTLTPGTRSAEVQVPLIEHRPSQGEKQFELFLTADPKIAQVIDKRIVATIKGAD